MSIIKVDQITDSTGTGPVTAPFGIIGNLTGTASTATTNANLTGPITSTGNTTSIADGAIATTKLAVTAGSVVYGDATGFAGVDAAFTFNDTTKALSVNTQSSYGSHAGGSYSVLNTDEVLTFNTGATVTLPTAVGIAGKKFTIINVCTIPANVAINTTSGQTIGFRASGDIVLRKTLDNITVFSDGVNYQILDKVEHDMRSATASGSINGLTTRSFQTSNCFLTLGIGEWELSAYFTIVGASASAGLSFTQSSGFYSSDGANSTATPTPDTLSVDGPKTYDSVVSTAITLFPPISGTTQQMAPSLAGTRLVVGSGTQNVYAVPCVAWTTASTATWYVAIFAKRIF